MMNGFEYGQENDRLKWYCPCDFIASATKMSISIFSLVKRIIRCCSPLFWITSFFSELTVGSHRKMSVNSIMGSHYHTCVYLVPYLHSFFYLTLCVFHVLVQSFFFFFFFGTCIVCGNIDREI